ncbi:hypothetical protein B9N43_11935 [Denitratisoma sp. DHT3]|nr:hypothetical protein B9N43_11935 [Denitratisoma sp. DHT3]
MGGVVFNIIGPHQEADILIPPHKPRRICPALLCLALGISCHAQATTETVLVTATRSAQQGFELPVAIGAVSGPDITDGQWGVNLSEALWRVPGAVALNRQNYAQDIQVSLRGFGARAAFGVRGVRLIQDGIPLTMPDGQGQAASIDLLSAARIEVLRGPFSALYGNHSGGVIQVFSEDGPEPGLALLRHAGGSDGTRDTSLKLAGRQGAVNYLLNASSFATDGARDHSAARRDSANARLRITLEGGTLTLLGNWLDQPMSQDPLGLSRAQFEENPRQADASALTYDTRKTIRQMQGGAVWEQRLGGDVLRLSAYSGTRGVTQYQSIPAATQTSPLHPGGVADFDRRFEGLGLRWTRSPRDSGDWELVAGIDADRMIDDRKGYRNFLGGPLAPTALGVIGALRRDEDNRVRSINAYLQGQWTPREDWTLHAGLRHTRVAFASRDRYLADGNDGSGAADYSDTSPVAGLLWRLTPDVHLYANLGYGFETPTFTEMSYRAGNLPGLNFDLKPSTSRSVEAGVKARPWRDAVLDAALFRVDSDDEIVVDGSAGGRTTYRNGGRTLRQGLELSLTTPLGRGLDLTTACSLLRAEYRDAIGAVAPGNRLPAVPAHACHGELAWRPGWPEWESQAATGFSTALEIHHLSGMYADDANTTLAPAYTVTALRAGWRQRLGSWELQEFLRVDNLTDRRYVGSVIVNERNGRYYEPAPGRAWMAGVAVGYRF